MQGDREWKGSWQRGRGEEEQACALLVRGQ